jgi:hypothetical protein
MTSDSLWYFAFGANMNSKIFLERRGMHPLSSEPAELNGYRLVFDHPGIPLVEPSFANVEKREGSKIYGVLYHMTRNEMALLNKMEGGGAYQNLDLEVLGTQSGLKIAHVYWTENTGITHLKPSRRYINVLLEGAKEHNLPKEWIEFLENQPTSPYYPILSPAMKGVMPLLNRLFKLGLGTPFQGWRERQHKKEVRYNSEK